MAHQITLEEAKETINEYPDQDEFVNKHYRLIGFEGDDNSMDLAWYWEDCKKLVDENNKKNL